MKPILLFDIDGTLLHVKKSFMQELIHSVMKNLGLSRSRLSEISFAGRTDRDIFSEIVELITDKSEKKRELYAEIKAVYLSVLLKEMKPEAVDVIDGAVETVQRAVECGLDTGLCTGNFREAAHKKVESAGLENVFTFGGFGCDYIDRKHLPEAAHREYVELKGLQPEREAYIVIGDTPNDIRSAKYFGAKSVAVTTGKFSRLELIASEPDHMIENLQELIPFYMP